MPRETLLDFFDDLAQARGVFLAHDDGYRRREHGYAEVARASAAFAARLQDAGLGKGDTIVLWSENRPEWIVALWGALLQGVIVVPIDYRASEDLLRRVAGIVKARVVLVGEEVDASGIGQEADLWPLAELDWQSTATAPRAEIARGDTAEIIFTSGATGDPKGVVITHGNILANIVPVEREILKYKKYARPFSPIRFLNLLPLSHMFGQSMATFIPPMLAGTVLFVRGFNPSDIVHHIRARRVSVLISVPKMLAVLRDHVERQVPETREAPRKKEHVAWRWWRYRRAHRMFGLKFWSFVVGAAPLDPELEAFWGRLGFVVIQGYGLTETAPIVSLNHPFRTSRGSVGKAIAGVEVKLADDGEILVRGENVTTGYFGASARDDAFDEEGWFHTGDIGEMDDEGRLFIKGRKKEMIVTSEGLNVFPEDVERVVAAVEGVKDVAVVGATDGGGERVYAVVVMDADGDTETVVRKANAQLADHQKIRGISRWPDPELPRTEGTRKLKRAQVREWVATGRKETAAAEPEGSGLEAVLARFAGGRDIKSATTLDELGLSSLERVELMVALEERFGTRLDESAFERAGNVEALEQLVRQPSGGDEPAQAPIPTLEFPAWNRRLPVKVLRRASLPTWILPLARVFARIRVEGLEHLEGLEGPVVFAANHQSHMDTPAILSALPAKWRYRTTVAMAKEFFRAHFFPEQFSRRARFTNSLNYYLAAAFFNAFPLPQREAGARQTLRYIGDLLADGWSVLIFPEGKRTEHGEINEFRAGVGMIGARLRVPVVPVRLEGLDKVLHQKARMASRGPVRVAFGAPLRLEGDDYAAAAGKVEAAVRAL